MCRGGGGAHEAESLITHGGSVCVSVNCTRDAPSQLLGECHSYLTDQSILTGGMRRRISLSSVIVMIKIMM